MTTLARIQRIGPLPLWIGLVLLASARTALPETIRIAAWKMSPRAGGAIEQQVLLDAASSLRKINPDVILLQGIPEREDCLKLADALGPTNYSVAVCSAFVKRQAVESTNIATLQELKSSYQSRIAKAQTELISAQRALSDRQAGLGNLGKELLAQGAMDWPEVSTEKVAEYSDTMKELEKLKEQERELLRRGYKDAHPLVQTVRALLRTYDSQRVELERAFPTLKYLGSNGDVGTNTAAPDIVGRLTELRKLRGQVAMSGSALSNLEFEASRLVNVESRIAEAERLRLEQQRAGSRKTEVAILTRHSGTRSGASAWLSQGAEEIPGGFAITKIRLGMHDVICMSASCADTAQANESARQLLNKVSSLRGEEDNRDVPIVIGTAFESDPAEGPGTGGTAQKLMESAGFMDALRDLPPPQRSLLEARGDSTSLNHILLTDTTYPFSPQLLCNEAFGHCIMVCDVELDPTRVAAALRARNELQVSTQHPATKPPTRLDLLAEWRVPVAAGAGTLLFLVLTAWGWKRHHQRNSTALVRIGPGGALAQPSAYTVVLAPKSRRIPSDEAGADMMYPKPVLHVETPITTQTQSASWQRRALAAEAAADQANAVLRAGLLPELSRWLKQKLVRKLITDREELITGQQAATRQVMAVDARLARIEAQMQHQNRAYIKRIEDLTAELQAAKEENRELIRARIAQVKKEMDAAREKLLKAESENQ